MAGRTPGPQTRTLSLYQERAQRKAQRQAQTWTVPGPLQPKKPGAFSRSHPAASLHSSVFLPCEGNSWGLQPGSPAFYKPVPSVQICGAGWHVPLVQMQLRSKGQAVAARPQRTSPDCPAFPPRSGLHVQLHDEVHCQGLRSHHRGDRRRRL